MYALTLNPLRFSPELTESILAGVKWTLGAVCPEPFAVREVVVAVREVVDNVLLHADWNGTPAPAFSIEYPVDDPWPRFRISTINAVHDPDAAERAVGRIQDCAATMSPDAIQQLLSARLIDVGSTGDCGAIGLLQVASSPRCELEVRLEGAVFHVRVDVDVPELGAQVAGRRRAVGVG